jgi:hypothetical protein
MNLTLEKEENVPLGPLNEIIWKFKRRKRIMNFMMLLSLPAAVFAIFFFLIFTWAIGFSSTAVFIFGFLVFSAVVSLIAILYIPDSLSAMINQMEATVQSISFAITPPKGETPEQRALNQLIRTDYCVRSICRKKPHSAQLNVKIIGKSGQEYAFDVYVHTANLLGRLFNMCSDINLFVKRYDETSPVGVALVKNVKEAVQDSLGKVGRRIPTRVLIISTTGFDEDTFNYVGGKEGVFRARFSSAICDIELIKENVDGSFDVLSF